MTPLNKLVSIVLFSAVFPFSAMLAAENFPREAQLELIALYKFIMEGKSAVPSEAQSFVDFDTIQLPLKCATPIVTNFVLDFEKFDKELVDRYALALQTRPAFTNEIYNSAGGVFKVHYTRSGSHAVYQANTTTGGVPNYVIGVARIFDSVYAHHVTLLGYPAPPSDGGYPSGVDGRYDVYLNNLGGAYYGLTYPDSLFFTSQFDLDATSFIVIENDYQESGFSRYQNNRLDAVRVTAAHEYFHAIHFGIDLTEMENYLDPVAKRPYWYEISAVWMEEEMYDNINDYYLTLPFFFNNPRTSIQQFNGGADFHPYASGVFAIFLAEKFGRDIIKSIWLKCGTMGAGPNMLEAAQIAIDSATGGAENFRSIFGEFALWNYFTGSRAAGAPPNVGYSEREFYPVVPESAFTVLDDYPASQPANSNPKNPEPNGSAYFKLNNTRAIFYETTPAVDTGLRIGLVLGNGVDSTLPQGWHVYQIDQMDSISNQYNASDTTFPDDTSPFVRIQGPRKYRSVVLALTPASWKWEPYSDPSWDSWFGYFITDSLVDSLIDTVLTIDSSAINVEPAVLSAYPNPAVLSQMGGQNLRFRFKIPTDSISIGTYSSPLCVVDIYTVAGELIKTCDTIANPYLNPNPYIRTVLFEIDWNMKTESGSNISSGVYICLGRLYSNSDRQELLAEEKAKVLIVR